MFKEQGVLYVVGVNLFLFIYYIAVAVKDKHLGAQFKDLSSPKLSALITLLTIYPNINDQLLFLDHIR